MTTTTLAPGSIFAGAYRVIAVLRQGSSRALYAVEEVPGGARRCLKVLHPDLVRGASLRQRFLHHVRPSPALRSEHLVEVLDAGIEAGSGLAWIAMEHLQGENLEAILRARGALPLAEVTELMQQLAAGLQPAHAAGLPHGNLKPQNLMLLAGEGGAPFRLKILNFGLSRFLSETQAGEGPTGTPAWMAPEQVGSSRPPTPATDVWAMGLLGFRALTGHPYWREASAGAMALLREVTVAPLPPVEVRAAEVGAALALPGGFSAWFARCVDRAPSARFPGAPEAYRGLLDALAGRAPAPRAQDSTLLLGSPESATLTAPPSGPASPAVALRVAPGGQPGPTRRRRWLTPVLLLGGALLCAAGVSGLGAYRDRLQRRRAATPGPPLAALPRPAPSAPSASSTPSGAPHGAQERAQPTPPPRACAPGTQKGCDPPPQGGRERAPARERERARAAHEAALAACRDGDLETCRKLGERFERGQGVPRSRERAFALYLWACKRGLQSGCLDARRLDEGRAEGPGAPPDLPELGALHGAPPDAPGAKTCGSASSCLHLGSLYQDGAGVPRDLPRAADSFRQACQQGSAEGCYQAGVMYAQGKGVARDPRQAGALLRRACDGGVRQACEMGPDPARGP